MKKLKIYSSQFNYQYGNSIHFPYSIASLFAYIKSFPELDKQLQKIADAEEKLNILEDFGDDDGSA